MNKFIVLIFKLALVLFLSLMLYFSLSVVSHSREIQSIDTLILILAVAGLIFTASIEIRKVNKQELDTQNKRIKVAVILSIYWAAIWIAFTAGAGIFFGIRYFSYGYILYFVIALFPLIYYLLKLNRISEKSVKISTNNLKEELNNEIEIDLKNQQLLKENKYQMAFQEVEENRIQNQELWAEAFAKCDGDREKQKSIYVKLRTKELNRGQKFTSIRLRGQKLSSIKLDIKQFIWLIILLVSIPLTISQIASLYNFHPNTTALDLLPRALGRIAGLIVGEGLIVTVIIGLASIKFGKKKWKWYDWFNMLAYTTLAFRVLDYLIKL